MIVHACIIIVGGTTTISSMAVVRFTRTFGKVLSRLDNNTGIYIDKPELLKSKKLHFYGYNFSNETMVLIREVTSWLL